MFLFLCVFLGNLPLGACCYICEEDCGSEYGLVDWLCCWCQRAVHSQCRIHIQEVFLFLSVFIYFSYLQSVARSGSCPIWLNITVPSNYAGSKITLAQGLQI